MKGEKNVEAEKEPCICKYVCEGTMGRSVASECDSKQCFSLSTIDKERMQAVGLNMTIKELQEQARKTLPFAEVPTGSASKPGRCRMTKIYRYSDFAQCNLKGGAK